MKRSFVVSFLLDLLYKIISAFAYSSVTNNRKTYPLPVSGMKELYKCLVVIIVFFRY